MDDGPSGRGLLRLCVLLTCLIKGNGGPGRLFALSCCRIQIFILLN